MKRPSIWSFLILATLLLPASARGFELFGEPYQSFQIPVPVSANRFMANACPRDYTPYIRAATTWNKVGCSNFRFKKGGISNRDSFRCDGADHIAFAPLDPGVLAVTSINCFGPERETGIFFNADANWQCDGNVPPGKIDLETVALHEFGHMLGLGHTEDNAAIMFPSYKGTQRKLANDDKDGICFLYPSTLTITGTEPEGEEPADLIFLEEDRSSQQ